MLNRSVRYHFNQHFRVPAIKAYEWCTDYNTQDYVLMHENAERSILHVSDGIVILTDLFQLETGSTTKQKLVNLYPDKLSWTSTHLTGRNKYSQFLYEIVPEGEKESRLEFTGLHVERTRKDSDGGKIGILTERLKSEDSAVWRLLAKDMERELGDHSPKRSKTRTKRLKDSEPQDQKKRAR